MLQHQLSPEHPSVPKYSIIVLFKQFSVKQRLRTDWETSMFSPMSLLLKRRKQTTFCLSLSPVFLPPLPLAWTILWIDPNGRTIPIIWMFCRLMPISITAVVRYNDISPSLFLVLSAVAGPTEEKFTTQGQVAGSAEQSGKHSHK